MRDAISTSERLFVVIKSESFMARIIPQNGELCQEQHAHLGKRQHIKEMRDFPTMGNNLEELRKARGWTQEEAAEEFGMSKGGYLKKARSERKLDTEFIIRAARIYGVKPSEVFEERTTVPIVGYVGAGSETHFYDGADSPNELAVALPGSNDSTVAVLIRGDSLGDVFDGWVAYYDDVRSPPTPDLLFRLCVIGLEDGRVLIKRLTLGTGRGLYHLVSQAGSIIKDQPVSWAALVKALLPRSI